MKFMIAAALFVLFGAVVFVPAQTRTITSNDLEKYRQKRLQAEREYRENYEKLGLPSPEELEIRRVEDKKRLEEISEKLRLERLEREAREAEFRRQKFITSQTVPVEVWVERPCYANSYFSGYYYGRGPIRRGQYFHRGQANYGWRVAGGSVIYEPGGRSSFVWPTPSGRSTSRIRSR